MDSGTQPARRREVSYFGPIFIRNNRVEISSAGSEALGTTDAGNNSKYELDAAKESSNALKYKYVSPRESIDVLKDTYKSDSVTKRTNVSKYNNDSAKELSDVPKNKHDSAKESIGVLKDKYKKNPSTELIDVSKYTNESVEESTDVLRYTYESPSEPIDVSKYKIVQIPNGKKQTERVSSPKRFLRHIGKSMGLVRPNSPSHRSEKHGSSPTQEPKHADILAIDKHKIATEQVQDTCTDPRLGLRKCNRNEIEDRSRVADEADVDKVLEKLDRALSDESGNMNGEFSFKISSSEDNYVMNKYRARSRSAIEIQDDSREINRYVQLNNNIKTCVQERKGDDTNETIQVQDNKPETMMKHRSKIAKLKQKFFESSPPKQNGRWPPATDKGQQQSYKDKKANESETSKASIEVDDQKSFTEEQNGYSPPKPPRLITNKTNHYATESKATMQRTLGNELKERHRRHSSDGLLRRSGAFDDINKRWSFANLTDLSTQYIAVVAIDFGTTYSGYAYSFTHDPDTVHLMRRQEGGDPGLFNQKTPTTVLLTPEGNFHSFGYAARDYYHDLDPKDAPKWMYFDRFKMLLHKDGLFGKESLLRTVAGKEMSAMKVFAYSLAYFKDLAIQELTDQSGVSITCDDIRWVLTVPAIWKASAKQFMRQAAYQAGIVPNDRPEQLLIALEPEAASIYCRRLRMFQMVSDSARASLSEVPRASTLSLPELRDGDVSIRSNDLSVGTRYMVVDCGGGTVDITVHELLAGGRLKELHRASGGAHGSVGVDEEFETLLATIFGQDIIEQFKHKRPSGWVELMAMFESRKRTASPYRSSNISVSFPFSFIDFYKKCRGSSPENAVRKHGDGDVSWTAGGMLRLAPGAMRRLFLPTLDRIKQAIGSVLNNPMTRDLSYLFLVGGFAESSVVQHEMRKDFGDLVKVIIPSGVGMTILKGAVYFGLDPNIVHERCSCLTYGVGVLHRFNPAKHPSEKLVSKDGINWCTDVFDTFVHVNQSVAMGDLIVRRYTPVRKQQTTTSIHIYSSDQADVKYLTDAGVIRCGTLTLNLPGDVTKTYDGERREIRTEMTFGGTEIKVTATDVKSGHFVEANIDFINS